MVSARSMSGLPESVTCLASHPRGRLPSDGTTILRAGWDSQTYQVIRRRRPDTCPAVGSSRGPPSALVAPAPLRRCATDGRLGRCGASTPPQ
jgi:hypothetical protein